MVGLNLSSILSFYFPILAIKITHHFTCLYPIKLLIRNRRLKYKTSYLHRTSSRYVKDAKSKQCSHWCTRPIKVKDWLTHRSSNYNLGKIFQMYKQLRSYCLFSNNVLFKRNSMTGRLFMLIFVESQHKFVFNFSVKGFVIAVFDVK